MAGCTCIGVCGCKPPVFDGSGYDPSEFTSLDRDCFAKTLAQTFVPLANTLRNMLTDFGLRLYAVRIVHCRYPSGDRRGVGAPYVERVIPVLPTPKVSGFEGLDENIESVGTQEVGRLTLEHVNAELTEEQLQGFQGSTGYRAQEGFDSNAYSFWEVELYAELGRTKKRKFQMVGPPTRKMLGWTVELQRSVDDRAVDGAVQLPS